MVRFMFGTLAIVATGASAFAPLSTLKVYPSRSSTSLSEGKQAESFGPAQLIRNFKESLPQIEWLADGHGNPANKIDMPDHVKQVLAQPSAPKREAESEERTKRIRARAEQAAADAAALKNMLVGEEDAKAWWRTPSTTTPKGGRK
eukprot:scaffold84120_cov67-Attheya_sp.AAC.1